MACFSSFARRVAWAVPSKTLSRKRLFLCQRDRDESLDQLAGRRIVQAHDAVEAGAGDDLRARPRAELHGVDAALLALERRDALAVIRVVHAHLARALGAA